MSTASMRDRDGDPGDAETVRAVFEDLPMMMLALAGPEHLIVAANAAYRAVAGRAQLVGRTLAEAFPEIRGQQLYEMYDRVYRTGVPQVAREWRIQADIEGDGTLADLWFDFTVTPRRDPDGTVTGLTLVAADVTRPIRERQAVERRYEQARNTILELQRELLPAGLPVLPRARLAAGYLPAQADTAAGGDWFDAVVLGDGRLALSIGDVVGHGVAASATMSRLRAVLEDRLLETGDIAAALTALDRVAERLPAARAATACVVVLDPASGAVSYCTAGHPPPLVVGAGHLPPTGAGPLGGHGVFPTRAARLAEGDLLVLVSDGLVERPGRPPGESLAEIAQVAADAAADRALRGTGLDPAQRVCSQTLELLLRSSGHADDVTILAVQRVAAPEPLRLDLRAEAGVVAMSHRAVGEWLRRAGVGAADVSALRHAVGELVTNCAEHAYLDTAGGPIRVTAELGPDGVARIEVSDDGQWRERRYAAGDRTGGLGLVLAGHVVDDLRMRPSATGTTATIRHTVRTPARMFTPDEVAPAPAADEPGVLLILDEPDGGGSRVRVDGPVTADTAGQLARELQRLTRNGTGPLTVDLTGVTVLSSAGVAALLAARERSRAHHTALTLHAEPGTAARHVLALTTLAPEPER